MTYGERTTEEMAELWRQVVPRNAAHGPRLARTIHQKIVREDIVGLEKRLEIDPDNAPLHDDVALLHSEAGDLDRTAAHFAETLRLRPDSAAAHYNLGNVLFRQGQRGEAIDHFRKALALTPDYSLAHDALGVALYIDIFNALNNNVVTQVNSTFGPNLLLPVSILNPRLVRVNVRVSF